MGISTKEHVNSHPLKEGLFETFVVADYLKQRFNKVQDNNLFYFQDSVGNEVDMVLDYGSYQNIVEIKSSETITKTHFKSTSLTPLEFSKLFLEIISCTRGVISI